MSDIRPAAHGAEKEPAAAPAQVLGAAAAASTAYTSAAAKGAATALVRMFMEQGVFGFAGAVPDEDGLGDADALRAAATGADAGTAAEVAAAAAPAAAEPTDWDRMCAAVARAEANRPALERQPAGPGLRLLGEAVARAGSRASRLRAVPPAA
ncbi:hypothetical protein OHA98_38885 [Streptomyces sp. NBC_00654]|uniref:hypothetical protein n=1 Tax=Streptomyces sp. NBC_00654 TaxID=2975799 RepID=UPI002254D0CC|nr:hypothetical protein [Streptomyces sp. NBC_00654]MCX4970617.1 hypothetical protein [Streptomyces sp. NBC_00654]